MPTDFKSTKVEIGKTLETKKDTGGDSPILLCSIKAELAVDRDLMTEIAGWSPEFTQSLFTIGGDPVQDISVLLTKRELLALDVVLTRNEGEDAQTDLVDPDKKPPQLMLPKALLEDMKFVPRNSWMSTFKFKLVWKARGDEVDDLAPLLDCESTTLTMSIQPAPREVKAQGGKVQPELKVIAERPADAGDLEDEGKPRGNRKPRGKRAPKEPPKAADATTGEPESAPAPSVDPAAGVDGDPPAPIDNGEPVAPSTPPTLTVVGPGFMEDAQQLAARRPRRDSPPRAR